MNLYITRILHMEQNNLVKVLIPRALKEAFTYAVPDNMAVSKGDFVSVPLGNKVAAGVVWDVNASNIGSGKIKPIIKKFDAPPMPEKLMGFLSRLADYNMALLGNTLKMSLCVEEALEPAPPKEGYELTGNIPDKITASRKAVIDILGQDSPLSMLDIKEKTGVSSAVIKSLLESDIIRKTILQEKQLQTEEIKWQVKFSSIQQQAADDLCEKVRADKYSATLLDGVTGSGKTEVYFAAVKEALHHATSQVLILLPEIALTGQIVNRFADNFGFMPLQWHSGISAKQRENNWRNIANGNARLIIGARSALFLPYKNLKLIVVDEEHDASYKQEEGVIYHGRDMAVMRANIENIPVILASATPSVETVENVKAGKYSELKLPSRHGGAVMPDIDIVDMRKEKLKNGLWISSKLQNAIAHNLSKGTQSMLFLNRRGYAPLTLCRNCGYRFKCPDCSSWLVEHRNTGKIMCHHCGYNDDIPEICPECQKDDMLVSCGPGVERIAEEAEQIFPNAKISMLTSDKMTSPSKIAQMIDEIVNGHVDIIIGTQVIAKGHHFPDLKLVGVIDADLGLEGGDLRAAERTYQLLQQVSGRAGREKDKGHVILQSYMPDNMLMKSLISGNRDEFVESEIASRKRTNMPPYSRLAAIIVSGRNERETANIAKSLVKSAPFTADIQILGPVPAPLYLLRGNFRQRLLVRCPRNINLQKWLKTLINNIAVPSSVKIKVDIDPYSFM